MDLEVYKFLFSTQGLRNLVLNVKNPGDYDVSGTIYRGVARKFSRGGETDQ